MGRYAGWIALHSGMAAGAHCILIPEIPYSLVPIAATIKQRELHAARSSRSSSWPRERCRSTARCRRSARRSARRCNSAAIGGKVAAELEVLTGKEARTVVLGHLLRGGSPTSVDRLLGLRFGAAAVRALEEGHDGVMVALDPPNVTYVPLDEATNRMKSVPAGLRHDPHRPRPRHQLRRQHAAERERRVSVAPVAWSSTLPVEQSRGAGPGRRSTVPPIPLSTSSRRGDRTNHCRAVPAPRPQTLSDTSATATNTRPSTAICTASGCTAVFDELGQDRGEEHDRLGIRRSDDEPVGHAATGSIGRRRAPTSIAAASRR